jgi:hypothetical protein
MASQSGPDPILLTLFANRFMSVAEAMGRSLQQTSISTNIKERLDFSCALFAPDGDLVANAPFIPIHLGSMSLYVYSVQRILASLPRLDQRCQVSDETPRKEPRGRRRSDDQLSSCRWIVSAHAWWPFGSLLTKPCTVTSQISPSSRLSLTRNQTKSSSSLLPADITRTLAAFFRARCHPRRSTSSRKAQKSSVLK